MKQTTIIYGIVAIVFAAGGFFGGTKYQQTKAPSFTRGQFGAGQTTNGQARNRAGGGMINGTILSVDTTSMTVKLLDNSSKIIILGNNTTYAKSTSASQTDLKVGDRVNAFGTTNTDGSVTAQSVQINPPQGRMERISPTPYTK